ncbi:response regulator [Paenibacillus psychroresistens]|uniref:Response regulator n=1 Tax=Paenibacillus psychroresistens TaxID=1778678 RepID=A0A6B8RR12_9BACL|nr:response regulator [Paenibacillus psychroresistens]QGQ97718.1 response regulator [Paenibacillus psychroresistens]
MISEIIKVLIVDDEVLIRNLLKMRISWDKLGLELVGEASNAHEALDLVEKLSPDIIFTDICMTIMDGIEFSKIVMENHPQIKIVVLTGHNEFDYVKRSIRIGISDFLLKPINKDEISRVALSLKEKIESERTNKNDYNKLKLQMEENLPYLRERCLNELLQSEFNFEDFASKLSYYKIELDLKSTCFQIVLVEVNIAVRGINEEEEKVLLNLQCMELIREVFKSESLIQVFFDNSHKIVILNNDESIDITDCCEIIKTRIINRFGCSICVGIGNRVEVIKSIKASYNEAKDALNYKVVAGKNQVIHYNDITFIYDNKIRLDYNHSEKLAFFMKAGLKEKARELIEELFSEFSYAQDNTLDRLRLVAFDALSTCLHVMAELNMNVLDIWKDRAEPYDFISKIDNLPEVKEYFNNLILKIITKVNSANSKKANKIILQIQDYVRDNLKSHELSLTEIAKKFFLNPSHLSRLFKQETNQTYIEYLTKKRIERAITLLQETDMRVYQIGEEVGITDPHYFSIIFKKFTGLSVNEYKKVNLN